MKPDEVTRVEIGGGPRRWIPVVIGGLVVWAAVAFVLGHDDGEDAAPATSTTTTTAASASSSTRGTTSPTSTTSVIPGAPLLGAATGWHLVVAARGVIARVIDLDTGVARQAVEEENLVGVGQGGIVTQSLELGVRWRPFSLEQTIPVRLEVGQFSEVLPLPDGRTAWVVDATGSETAGPVVRLVSLASGTPLGDASVGPLADVIGLAGSSLIVAGGGDTYAVAPDRTNRRVADGYPLAVLGNRVLVQTCDADLDCEANAIDVTTGDVVPIPGIGRAPWFFHGPVNAIGGIVVQVPNEGVLLITPTGDLRGLPAEVTPFGAEAASWTPDGRLLLVPADTGDVLVVDPFAAGGATIVSRFPINTVLDVRLAVVAGQPSVD